MSAPTPILELVERFERHRDAYHSGRYNEAQLRREFLDPFFDALGWDMQNRQGYAEAYKDVIYEDAIKVGGATKAPDYCFRIGGTRKFFVEAKKPSVSLKDAVSPAFQLRRYAWSAKLPLSVLSDFDEFAVYDCRIRPDKSDKAATARVMYLTWADYEQRWDELAAIFSREAVLKGSFDRYAESKRAKKGTTEVDDAFLREIESWRDLLARSLALRNPNLTPRQLNTAVQATIDRIVFLRICEDRGVEDYGRLLALLNGGQVYERLCNLFRQADERYNSGLFHFRAERDRPEPPDDLTLSLAIDDRPLKDIVKNLYYPDSPYEFSVLPADILGQVYEQFLGQVIRLTAGHRAVVEAKPEVKKAGGVYYTPTYIVDYIVKNTVGRLVGQIGNLSNRTPLRILDPACGSGSFLLGAYQYLLDWHLQRYLAEGAEKWAKGRIPRLAPTPTLPLPEGGQGEGWRLTTSERKRILLDHIYGVDIDPQAVEVTKLSLLLKVLEGENEQTLARQLTFFHERALPDLGQNIKCGNSLIGPDFYAGRQMSFLDEEERYRINAFDWETEFPEAMREGGFDAVIGNPPWGGDIDRELDYFHSRYPATTQEHTDSFKIFIEAGLRLARTDGLVSMIVPNTVLRQRRLKDVRSLMLKAEIATLVDLGEDVFENVVAPSCILVIRKKQSDSGHRVSLLNLIQLSNAERSEYLTRNTVTVESVEQESFQSNADLEFTQPAKRYTVPVTPLGEFNELACKDAGINYQRVSVGMQEKGKSDLADRLLYEGKQQKPQDKMYWKGSDIGRYWIAEATSRFCRTNYRSFIRANEVVHLSDGVYNTTPKILLRQTADHIIATIDRKGVWFGRSVIAIVPTPKSDCRLEYSLGLMNSRYFEWLYHSLVQEKGRVFAQVKLSKLKQLPIRRINFSDPTDKARHDRMVALVEGMLALHRELAAARTAHEQTALQRQIAATDRQIDALVYELYGLTEEDIAIVEGRSDHE